MALTTTQIEALEQKGFKRWQKNGMDRMYINATRLGLELDFYKTGNISCAFLDGSRISNCQARRLREVKTYIDVETGIVHSGNDDLLKNAQKLLDEVLAA